MQDAAAHTSALGLPPPSQSSNSYSDCRTGLEKETREESTKVMSLTPHASSVRATAHPSVPAPVRECRTVTDQLWTQTASNCISGTGNFSVHVGWVAEESRTPSLTNADSCARHGMQRMIQLLLS
eukprot:1138071-Pelagomonas_calceolata.AAC.1